MRRCRGDEARKALDRARSVDIMANYDAAISAGSSSESSVGAGYEALEIRAVASNNEHREKSSSMPKVRHVRSRSRSRQLW